MFTRASSRAIALAALIPAVTIAGCASVRGRTQGPTVPIDVEVRNNLLLPTDLTVYTVDAIGNRTLLGGVPPGATTVLRFKPVSFSEPYRLLARRALGRDIRSQSFSVLSDMTGRIIWTLVPNIVGFEDIDVDSARTDTSASAPGLAPDRVRLLQRR
jgi:hypothetical protein